MALSTKFYTNTTLANPQSGASIFWHEIIKDGRSPKFTLEMDRSSASRVVETSWSNWGRFAQCVLGYATLGVDENGKPGLSRAFPWSIPINNTSNRRFLFASKIEIEGIGTPTPAGSACVIGSDNNAMAWYERARHTITFDTRTYDILADEQMGVAIQTTTGGGGAPGDAQLPPPSGIDESRLVRYVTKIVKPAGEFLTLDSSAYYYAGLLVGGNIVPMSRGQNKVIGSYNVSITWHLVPKEAVPSELYNPNCVNKAIDKCLGRVNRADFDGMKQGTMLLMAVELKPMVSPLGDRVFDITYMFKYFSPSATAKYNPANVPGHNHIYRSIGGGATANVSTNGWYEAFANRAIALATTNTFAPTNFVAQTDGINIYDWADFNNLFRPANYPPPN